MLLVILLCIYEPAFWPYFGLGIVGLYEHGKPTNNALDYPRPSNPATIADFEYFVRCASCRAEKWGRVYISQKQTAETWK